MKTEDLISMLARGAGPAPRAVVARRLAPVAVLGLPAAALLALAVLGPVPAAMFATPAPWIKLAYAAALAAAAGWLAAGLSRPVARLGLPAAAVAAVLGLMAALGGLAGWLTPAASRMTELLGHSWQTCPLSVLGCALPALAGGLWALHGLAPTRPMAAGLAVGLFAGALGAAGYALACEETSTAFIAVWYTLGIALTGALGALLGPRVLRW